MTTMTYEQEKESLARVLRDKIFSYKAARPNLSSSQIASKFGMSSSTFSRLENLDIKNPTFDQIIKIFNGTGDKEGLVQYLKKYYPIIANTYGQLYSHKDSDKYFGSETIKNIIDPQAHQIMLLAISKTGVSRELIQNEYGNTGVRTLDRLHSEGIVFLKDNRYFARDEGNIFPTQRDTKELVRLTLENSYDLQGFEDQTAGNFLSFQTEGINLDKVYPKVVSLLKELNNEIRTIFNNPENLGEDVVFVSLISDTIVKNDLQKRNREKKEKMQ